MPERTAARARPGLAVGRRSWSAAAFLYVPIVGAGGDVVQRRRVGVLLGRLQLPLVRRAVPATTGIGSALRHLAARRRRRHRRSPPCSAPCSRSGSRGTPGRRLLEAVGDGAGDPARPGAGHRAAVVLLRRRRSRSVCDDGAARARRVRHGVRRRRRAGPARAAWTSRWRRRRGTSAPARSRRSCGSRSRRIAPAIVAGRAAGVHALARRVRDRVLHRRADHPDPARSPIYSMVRFGVTPRSTPWRPSCVVVSIAVVVIAARTVRTERRGMTDDPDRPARWRRCSRSSRSAVVRRRRAPSTTSRSTIARERVLRAARPVRLRQDHAAAVDRRLRAARQRGDPARRRRPARPAAAPAAGQPDVPVLRAVPAHDAWSGNVAYGLERERLPTGGGAVAGSTRCSRPSG